MAAPTFVAEYEAAWNSSATPKTVSVTVNAGDVLVIAAVAENYLGTAFTAPTGGGLTYVLQQDVAVSDYAHVAVWTAVASSAQTFTLSVGLSGGLWWGFNCLRFSGSDGVGASAKATASGTPSVSVTTTGANSAVVTAIGDWNATDGTSRAWLSSATEVSYFRNSSRYTVYGAYSADVGAAGAKTVGLSAPSGQKYAIAAVEVLGVAATTVSGTVGATLPTLAASAAATATSSGTTGASLSALTATASGVASGNGTLAASLPAPTAALAGGGGTQESLFTTQTPTAADNSDGGAGITTATTLKFAVAGTITQVRFYATATVGGTYTAEVWEVTAADGTTQSGTGTLLSSQVMSGSPTAGAWNTVALGSTVTADPTKLYRVGIHNNQGRYVASGGFWSTTGLTNGNITAVADGYAYLTSSIRQGTFKDATATAGVYPNLSFNQTNYFADVVFVADAGSGASGALNTPLPALTVTLAGSVVDNTAQGTLGVSLPALTATVSGAAGGSGIVSVALPALTAGLSGTVVDGTVRGTLTGALPVLAVSTVGSSSTSGAFAAVLPTLSTGIQATAVAAGTITATLPILAVAMQEEIPLSAAQPLVTTTATTRIVTTTQRGRL